MKNKPRPASKTVDEYIQRAPAPARKELLELRQMIRRLAPEATERMSYGMPAFFLGRNLVYYAAHAAHVGLYPGARAIEAHERELSGYKHAKGSIQFPMDEPLPARLIKSIVRFKITEIARKKK